VLKQSNYCQVSYDDLSPQLFNGLKVDIDRRSRMAMYSSGYNILRLYNGVVGSRGAKLSREKSRNY
jgi:hypothetical protein